MRTLTLIAALTALSIGAAAAQDTTVVRREGVGGSRTVVRTDDGTTVRKKVVRTDSTGCRTKSVKKTDGMGDSVTKTKSSC